MNHENQYEQTLERLEPEIKLVAGKLSESVKASTIVNELFSMGLQKFEMIFIFRQATGASIGDLKSLGQWLSDEGITNIEAFDERANEILNRQRKI